MCISLLFLFFPSRFLSEAEPLPTSPSHTHTHTQHSTRGPARAQHRWEALLPVDIDGTVGIFEKGDSDSTIIQYIFLRNVKPRLLQLNMFGGGGCIHCLFLCCLYGLSENSCLLTTSSFQTYLLNVWIEMQQWILVISSPTSTETIYTNLYSVSNTNLSTAY